MAVSGATQTTKGSPVGQSLLPVYLSRRGVSAELSVAGETGPEGFDNDDKFKSWSLPSQ